MSIRSSGRGEGNLRCILICFIAGLMLTPANSNANPTNSNLLERRERTCRYQWLDPGTWTAREERRTTACVLARWSVPAGDFNRIISCESDWNRLAYNPAGPYVGLGQHALSSWMSRVRSYAPRFWNLSPNWRNSRTMLTITARMMHAEGLGAWGCA